MKRSASKGSRVWFWVGTVLLSISALWWLIIILVIVSESDGAGILVGVMTTVVPVGIGVYGVIQGRRHPVYAEEISSSPIITTKELGASTRSGIPATKRESSEPFCETQGLAAYIKSATAAMEGMGDGQGFETHKGDAGIESTTVSTLTVSIWGRIRFIWDIFVLSFPLWCPGNAAIRFTGGLVEVFYEPPKRNRETIDRFIRRSIWFASRAMDRFLRHKEVERVNIWVLGKVRSEEEHRKRVWKRLRLTLELKNWRYMQGANRLSRLAAENPQQYLGLCSAQWVEEAEFPVWPTSGVAGGGEAIGGLFTSQTNP